MSTETSTPHNTLLNMLIIEPTDGIKCRNNYGELQQCADAHDACLWQRVLYQVDGGNMDSLRGDTLMDCTQKWRCAALLELKSLNECTWWNRMPNTTKTVIHGKMPALSNHYYDAKHSRILDMKMCCCDTADDCNANSTKWMELHRTAKGRNRHKDFATVSLSSHTTREVTLISALFVCCLMFPL